MQQVGRTHAMGNPDGSRGPCQGPDTCAECYLERVMKAAGAPPSPSDKARQKHLEDLTRPGKRGAFPRRTVQEWEALLDASCNALASEACNAPPAPTPTEAAGAVLDPGWETKREDLDVEHPRQPPQSRCQRMAVELTVQATRHRQLEQAVETAKAVARKVQAENHELQQKIRAWHWRTAPWLERNLPWLLERPIHEDVKKGKLVYTIELDADAMQYIRDVVADYAEKEKKLGGDG